MKMCTWQRSWPEIRFFELPADARVSVFEIHRVGLSRTGERIRLTVTACPTDRNRLVLNVGETPSPEVQEESPD
jgi:hypothetical protein